MSLQESSIGNWTKHKESNDNVRRRDLIVPSYWFLINRISTLPCRERLFRPTRCRLRITCSISGSDRQFVGFPGSLLIWLRESVFLI